MLLDNNLEWVQETKRMIDAEGGISEAIQTDVTDEESCRKAVARTMELFGAVHILVNIGESSVRPVVTHDESHHEKYFMPLCGSKQNADHEGLWCSWRRRRRR